MRRRTRSSFNVAEERAVANLDMISAALTTEALMKMDAIDSGDDIHESAEPQTTVLPIN